MGTSLKVRLVKGQRFGLLVVEREIETMSSVDWRSRRVRYECICDCGRKVITEAYRLRGGQKKSCGCLQPKVAAEVAKRRKTHGCAGRNRPPEYMVWVRMRRRCENPDSQDYSNYGGRGIKVCGRWSSFQNFIDDMGPRPDKGYSIDRIDNDGPYSPENCRWATVKQQNRNKRSIKKIEIDGVIRGLGEWAEVSGTNLETIRSRLNRHWDPKEAVFGEIRQEMTRVGNRWSKRTSV